MRNVLLCMVAACAFTAVGCDRDHHDTPPPPSPFAGFYEGSWESTRTDESGGFSCSINTEGVFVGIYENAGELSRLDGAVAPEGQYTGTITPPNADAVAIEGTMALTGIGISGTLSQIGYGQIATFTATRT